ncbi:MAG: HAD family hydrolase [Deltaproteobacteria bacterium]|jgi:phosphoglycolate phosphatase|nr:HAD family hydrolase [Deltaproteobacteria bacterium]
MTTLAAIFDLDGTVLNTLPDLADSLNLALEAAGYPTHDLEGFRPMVGGGMAKMIERALPEGSKNPETLAKVMAYFKKEYAKRQCDKTVPYDGIVELLKDLAAKGWLLGLLSNKDHENTLEVVGHFFPGLFSKIIGVRPGFPTKPDPSGALEICQAFGLSPSQVFYVGDSGVDMATAKGAGCRPIGVAWGFRPKDELLAGGALAILEEPCDFLEVAANLPNP